MSASSDGYHDFSNNNNHDEDHRLFEAKTSGWDGFL